MFMNPFRKKAAYENGRGRKSALHYRIGDRVKNGSQGTGTVRAVRPDGAIIVRFDGKKKSQSIYPSLLN